MSCDPHRYIARSGTEYWPLYSCVRGRGGTSNGARVFGTNFTTSWDTRTGGTEGSLILSFLYKTDWLWVALLLSVGY